MVLRPADDAPSGRSDDSQGVRSVLRALDLLIELTKWDRPARLSEVAKGVGLHPTTALRLLESLRSRGFVAQTPDHSYTLGSRTFDVGTAFMRNVSIWSQANSLADRLAEMTRETASVGVLDEGQILYIAIARGQKDMGIASAPGTRHPLYCTSLGKAIMAELSTAEVNRLLDADPPQRLTPNTIVDAAEMRRELGEVRAIGYAVDNEERTPGVVCIGAVIRDHRGEPVGALSISGSASRMRETGVDALGRLVVQAANVYTA
ncbi:MAG TPA: IclR family transcriptional regulator [Gryllotalpicola sp.]